MKTMRVAFAAAIVAACGLLAVATPASAYPDAMCSITDPGVACAGETLTLNAAVSGLPDGASCDPISITWNGITRTGTGSTLAANFPTSLADIGNSSSSASCTYIDNQTGERTVSTAGAVIVNDPGSDGDCSTLDDDDDSDDTDDTDGNDSDSDGDSDSDSDDSDDNGGLPNTGGERLLWLIIGLLLVAGGTYVVVRSRRAEGGTAT